MGRRRNWREHGGNSLRTWTTDNGRDTGKQVLDRALSNGLYVAMGLDVDHERRGFDYDNTNAVARQLDLLKAQVLQYRNHPALLVWVVGNELNFEKNPKVWDAVNDLSKMIHEIDPNHPTTTTLAGFKQRDGEPGQDPGAGSGFRLLPDVLATSSTCRDICAKRLGTSLTSSPNGARPATGSAARRPGAHRLKTTAPRRRTFTKSVSGRSSNRTKSFVSARMYFSGATSRSARPPGMACSSVPARKPRRWT